MAVENKKISSLTEWIYGNIHDLANIVVAHAGSNYRIAMQTIRQYVLGDRAIGGTDSGDIVTTDDIQSMTNKYFASPRINSANATVVTSDELNRSAGVTSPIQTQLDAKAPLASPNFTGTVVLPSTTSIGTVTNTEIAKLSGVTSPIQSQLDAKAPLASPTFTGTVVLPSTTSIGDVSNLELGYLNGVTGSIQNQIDGVVAGIQSATSIVRCYTATHVLGSGVTNKVIDEATIRDAIYSGSGSYRVNHLSVMAQAFIVSGDGLSHSKTLDQEITVSSQISSGVTFLDNVDFKGLTGEKTYAFVITCQLKAGPQGT